MPKIEYMFYFFKICGVATMKFNINLIEKGIVQGSWFASSKKGSVYNVILICFIVAISCLSIHNVYSWSKIEFERILDVVLYLYTNVIAILILIVYCFRQKQTIAIARKLQILREFTMAVNGQVGDDDQSTVCSLKRIFIANVVMWLLLIVFSLTELRMFLYSIATYPCIVIINCVFLQYTVILRIVNQLYRALNANIVNISKELSWRRLDSSLDFSKVRTNSLSDVRELYSSLCNLSGDVSEFYHPLMLFCMSYLFVTLLSWTYYIVAPFFVQVTIMPIISGYTRAFILVIHHAFMLVVLTQSASAVTRENKRTGEIINKGLANFRHQRVMHELNMFSNYLLHKDVNFTVYGLFELNESLLMSFAGSITTYLVILLQFHSSD